jgi:hypothetical protein
VSELHVLLKYTGSQFLCAIKISFICVSEYLVIPIFSKVVFDHKDFFQLLYPHSFQILLLVVLPCNAIFHFTFEYWCLILLKVQSKIVDMARSISCINNEDLFKLRTAVRGAYELNISYSCSCESSVKVA